MTVAFDASFMLYLFAPAGEVGTPLDSEGAPITFAKERVQALLKALEAADNRIVIPTPALSEVMVRSGVEAGQSYLAIIDKSKAFRIAAFDQIAAVELPLMYGLQHGGGDLKAANDGTYAKVKYDRQIVAIARTTGCKALYSDDRNQRNFAKRVGLEVRGLGDCEVPTDEAQGDLF